jgi:glycosyltransferase involved in cell wall biosynthesis
MSMHSHHFQSSRTSAGRKPQSERTCVLHLCPELERDDPARETVDLAILTQRSGWRAVITSSGGPLVTESERAGVRHTRMPLRKPGPFINWRNRVHLETLFQREHPALVHAHGVETLGAAIGLSRSHRLPLVADLTQPLIDTPAVHRLIDKLRKLSCVIRVPSEYMGLQLLDVFHIAPEHIYHVHPGIDLQWYNASAISAERLQNLSQLWRLPESATVILLPLPLCPGMGHMFFLKALRQIKNENFFVVMVGHDRHAPGLRQEIEQFVTTDGLNGKVIMPETCTDWPAAYWLSSVIAATNTVPRGQHLELLAAQAVGRPVIATNSGANREMVLDGKTAWIVPPEDEKALAAALLEAIHLDTGQRLHLAQCTRQFIAENFPQNTWSTTMMELYETLLKPTKRGE